MVEGNTSILVEHGDQALVEATFCDRLGCSLL